MRTWLFALLASCGVALADPAGVVIRGASMLPALSQGDSIKLCAVDSIHRADIVLARYGSLGADSLIVKRIAGLPGDTLSDHGLPLPRKGHRAEVIPEGYYYLLGDNPSASRDSRHFGFVHRQYIRGVLIIDNASAPATDSRHHGLVSRERLRARARGAAESTITRER